MLAMHVRSITEHFALPQQHVLDQSRTAYASRHPRDPTRVESRGERSP